MTTHLKIYGAKNYATVYAVHKLANEVSFIFSVDNDKKLSCDDESTCSVGIPMLAPDGEVCLWNDLSNPSIVFEDLSRQISITVDKVKAMFKDDDRLYMTNILDISKHNEWLYTLLTKHKFGTVYDWIWPSFKMFPLFKRDFERLYAELNNPTFEGMTTDPFIIEKRKILQSEFFRLCRHPIIKSFFTRNFLNVWFLNPVVDKASFLKTVAELNRDSLSVMTVDIDNLDIPEIRQLMDVVRELRELDWVDPFVLFRDDSYYDERC